MTAVETISGCSILPTIHDQTNEYVYHGTPLRLDEIEPRECRFWLRGQYVPDTEVPVVCATDEPIIAAFRALVPRTSELFGCGRARNRWGGFDFLVQNEARHELERAVGYVALGTKQEFDIYKPPDISALSSITEYRRQDVFRPKANVEIDYTDFEEMCFTPGSRNRLLYLKGERRIGSVALAA